MKYNSNGKPIPTTLLMALPLSSSLMPVAGTSTTRLDDKFSDLPEVICKTYK
jgi:hypothetical protein